MRAQYPQYEMHSASKSSLGTLSARHVDIVKIFGLIVVTAICCSCATSDFQGDGKFVDHGPFAAKNRYVLDLGPVDLGKPGKYTYSIGGLPKERFVVGLEVVELQPNNIAGNRPAHSGRIHLVVETAGGEMVVDEGRPLSSWTWSFVQGDLKSFLYTAGKEQWISVKEGVQSAVHLDVRVDEGWGTFFVPRERAQYRVTLDVIEGQSAPRPTRLILRGGGWK